MRWSFDEDDLEESHNAAIGAVHKGKGHGKGGAELDPPPPLDIASSFPEDVTILLKRTVYDRCEHDVSLFLFGRPFAVRTFRLAVKQAEQLCDSIIDCHDMVDGLK